MKWPSFAFVDLETTGLSPSHNRITEIGLVLIDGNHVEEWTTLLNPRSPIKDCSRWIREDGESALKKSPTFNEIAKDLLKRLEGRMFIAHNARFDYGFLKAEFLRVGMEFTAPVICSAMLSRKLYAHLPSHDLDALMVEHDLYAGPRHRALPDARLVWQLWQIIQLQHSRQTIEAAIETLLAGPVLPAGLDPRLIDKLPDRPGIFFLHGPHDQILQIGHASNLRLHLLNYFRIDRNSAKALDLALRICNITFRVSEGIIGARLQSAILSKTLTPKKGNLEQDFYSWLFVPEDYPSLKLINRSNEADQRRANSFGLFLSERRAKNAMLRLAMQYRLCHLLLGISEKNGRACLGCAREERGSICTDRANRLKHLTSALVALEPLRTEPWPFAGPVGIRERAGLHVLNDWRYVGTGRNEADVNDLIAAKMPIFDKHMYRFLVETLRRLPRRKIIDLAPIKANSGDKARRLLRGG